MSDQNKEKFYKDNEWTWKDAKRFIRQMRKWIKTANAFDIPSHREMNEKREEK